MSARLARAISIFFDWHRIDWVTTTIAVGSDNVRPERLRKAGVRAVLSVGASVRGSDGFDVMSVAVPDKHPPSAEDLQRMLDWLRRKEGEGLKVFVHCHAGMGRSVTVVAAYLISKGYRAEEALRLIKNVHPQSSPTPKQLEFLKSFEGNLRWHPKT